MDQFAERHRHWLVLMRDPLAEADQYVRLWSGQQAHLAIKRAMRRDPAIPRFPALPRRDA